MYVDGTAVQRHMLGRMILALSMYLYDLNRPGRQRIGPCDEFRYLEEAAALILQVNAPRGFCGRVPITFNTQLGFP